MVKIIHISDLHFGTRDEDQDNPTKKRAAKDERFTPEFDFVAEIDRQDPDIIVASGDFVDSTDRNLDKSFELAKTFLDRASSNLKKRKQHICECAHCTRVHVVPGNHDVIRYPKGENLTTFDHLSLFDKYIGENFCAPETSKSKTKEGHKDSPEVFRVGSCYVYPTLELLLYLFSTVDYFKPDEEDVKLYTRIEWNLNRLEKYELDPDAASKTRASPEPSFSRDKDLAALFGKLRNDKLGVGQNALKRLDETIEEVGGRLKGRLSTFAKIAVIHHNLADAMDVDVKRDLRFYDARAFKDHLCKNHFDLVLSGHKHAPFGCYELSSGEEPNWGRANWGLHTLVAPECKVDRTSDHDAIRFLIVKVEKDRRYEVVQRGYSPAGLSQPVRFWSFTAGRSGKPKIPVVCWPGYNVPEVTESASRNGIRFIEHQGLIGDFRHLRLESDEAMLVIDDQQRIQAAIRSASVQTNPKTLTAVLKGKPAVCLLDKAEYCDHMLPLRCGLNAIARRVRKDSESSIEGSADQRPTVANLLVDARNERGETLSLGAWDRSDICIPFLYCAAFPENNVLSVLSAYSVRERELTRMVRVLRKKIDDGRLQPITIYKDIADLSRNLLNGTVDAVVGAGSWLGESESFRSVTVIPREGALLWVEAAAVVGQPSPQDQTRLAAFLENLLTPEAQKGICDPQKSKYDVGTHRSIYAGCPVVQGIEGYWESKKNDIQKIFADPQFTGRVPEVFPQSVTPDSFASCWKKLENVGVIRR